MLVYNSWCPWEPFSTDNLILLYKRQRKMKWLEVMDLDRLSALQEIIKTPKLTDGLFTTARKLALYPENRLTMDLCQFYVMNTYQVLEELIVHANFDANDFVENEDTINTRDLNDTATGPGLISSTIFGHMMPFEKCEPLQNLRSLRLHRISLRHCTDTWCKFVDFTRIEQLRLYQCPGVDSLLGQLGKANNLPKRLKTLEVQHKDNSENEALVALDGFLCLVSGIRDLVIDMEHVKALPAAAGILRHGKTLELLNVHCSQECELSNSRDHDHDELVWDSEQFEKICKACTILEQLSCAWPEMNIIEVPDASPAWTAFERACANLTNMVTLHISTWPMNKTTHSNSLVLRPIYDLLMSTVAQRLFEVVAHTHSSSEVAVAPDTEGDLQDTEAAQVKEKVADKLRLVGFGISEKIYEREDSKNQILFLRSTALDCLGQPKIHATPIGWCLRQYVEPRSEVLDFVLHRNTRPPCRDTGWPTVDDDELTHAHVQSAIRRGSEHYLQSRDVHRGGCAAGHLLDLYLLGGSSELDVAVISAETILPCCAVPFDKGERRSPIALFYGPTWKMPWQAIRVFTDRRIRVKDLTICQYHVQQQSPSPLMTLSDTTSISDAMWFLLVLFVAIGIVHGTPLMSYGNTTSLSPDGSCGGTSGFTCLGSPAGESCSQWGWCGSNDAYSGAGCQAAYGRCGGTAAGTSSVVGTSVMSSNSACVNSAVATTITVTTSVLSTTTVWLTASSTSSTAPTPTPYNIPSSMRPVSTRYSISSTQATSAASSIAAGTSSVAPAASGSIKYQVFSGDGSEAQGWPSMDKWASFETVWANNVNLLQISCTQFGQANNAESEIAHLKTAVLEQSSATGVDSRFITAIMMQESKGCVRVPTTTGSVSNPGIFQSHQGSGSCNNGPGQVKNPCPATEIKQMVKDGVAGTSSGDGLQQTIAGSGAAHGTCTSYYRGSRAYNSGSVAASGKLEDGVATHCYVSDIANRLLGWSESISLSTCPFDKSA
nr:hypothetical protein CFP56_19667 [Quercus suber]